MSRGEELRAKFKAKGEAIRSELESPFGQFRSSLDRFVVEVCDASIENAFARSMYESWEASKKNSLDAWLLHEVKPLFTSAGPAPKWRLEPRWLYHQDKPMTFVMQYDHEQQTLYIFEGRQEIDDGWVKVIKMTAQDDEGIVILSGEITG